MTGDRQRIDKWLWFARVVKTRTLAQELAESGRVRLNGRKVDASSQPVKVGDVLTIGIAGRVRVLEVKAFAERRGGAPEAQTLYEDKLAGSEGGDPATDAPGGSEATPLPAATVRAERGTGRPTKRERRRFDRMGGDGSE